MLALRLYTRLASSGALYEDRSLRGTLRGSLGGSLRGKLALRLSTNVASGISTWIACPRFFTELAHFEAPDED